MPTFPPCSLAASGSPAATPPCSPSLRLSLLCCVFISSVQLLPLLHRQIQDYSRSGFCCAKCCYTREAARSQRERGELLWPIIAHLTCKRHVFSPITALPPGFPLWSRWKRLQGHPEFIQPGSAKCVVGTETDLAEPVPSGSGTISYLGCIVFSRCCRVFRMARAGIGQST